MELCSLTDRQTHRQTNTQTNHSDNIAPSWFRGGCYNHANLNMALWKYRWRYHSLILDLWWFYQTPALRVNYDEYHECCRLEKTQPKSQLKPNYNDNDNDNDIYKDKQIVYNFALIPIYLNTAIENKKKAALTTWLSTPTVEKVLGTNSIQLCSDS